MRRLLALAVLLWGTGCAHYRPYSDAQLARFRAEVPSSPPTLLEAHDLFMDVGHLFGEWRQGQPKSSRPPECFPRISVKISLCDGSQFAEHLPDQKPRFAALLGRLLQTEWTGDTQRDLMLLNAMRVAAAAAGDDALATRVAQRDKQRFPLSTGTTCSGLDLAYAIGLIDGQSFESQVATFLREDGELFLPLDDKIQREWSYSISTNDAGFKRCTTTAAKLALIELRRNAPAPRPASSIPLGEQVGKEPDPLLRDFWLWVIDTALADPAASSDALRAERTIAGLLPSTRGGRFTAATVRNAALEQRLLDLTERVPAKPFNGDESHDGAYAQLLETLAKAHAATLQYTWTDHEMFNGKKDKTPGQQAHDRLLALRDTLPDDLKVNVAFWATQHFLRADPAAALVAVFDDGQPDAPVTAAAARKALTGLLKRYAPAPTQPISMRLLAWIAGAADAVAIAGDEIAVRALASDPLFEVGDARALRLDVTASRTSVPQTRNERVVRHRQIPVPPPDPDRVPSLDRDIAQLEKAIQDDATYRAWEAHAAETIKSRATTWGGRWNPGLTTADQHRISEGLEQIREDQKEAASWRQRAAEALEALRTLREEAKQADLAYESGKTSTTVSEIVVEPVTRTLHDENWKVVLTVGGSSEAPIDVVVAKGQATVERSTPARTVASQVRQSLTVRRSEQRQSLASASAGADTSDALARQYAASGNVADLRAWLRSLNRDPAARPE